MMDPIEGVPCNTASASISLLSLENIAFVLSSCCSLNIRVGLLNSSTAWLKSAHAGIDNNQVVHCTSVIPLPRVRPQDVLRLFINICSTIKLIDNPAKYLS